MENSIWFCTLSIGLVKKKNNPFNQLMYGNPHTKVLNEGTGERQAQSISLIFHKLG